MYKKWNGPFCSFSFLYLQIAVLQGRARQHLITVQCNSVCGATLKHNFRNRARVYLIIIIKSSYIALYP